MRTSIAQWESIVAESARNLFAVDVTPWKPLIDHASDRKFGDFTSNVAMRLAREAKRPPREIAEKIARALEGRLPGVERISIAGAGFVNLHVAPAYFAQVVDGILATKELYGSSAVGAGKKVQIEFVSANPTGPLTVAHGRQAAVGDVLARVMKFAGYDVTREYFWNDSGNQMNILGRSIGYYILQQHGRGGDFPEEGYKGGYIEEIAKTLMEREPKAFGSAAAADAVTAQAGAMGGDIIRKWIEDDLGNFRVVFDHHTSQRNDIEARGLVDALVGEWEKRGLTYAEDGALWFRAKDYGDVEDRVLRKSDGSFTYRTPDIAYHREKYKTYDMVIDLWGPDHHAHISCMASALKAMGIDKPFKVIIVQFCTLYRGSEKLKMSTRAGEFVTLRQVMEEVGVDATRYFFVMRKTDAHLDFDLEVAKKQSMDNPVYYIQYAHARICSIFRKGIEEGLVKPEEIGAGMFIGSSDLALMGEGERTLVAMLDRFPAVVAGAAEAQEPHRLANYVHELAGLFQTWYQQGDKDQALRALCQDAATCRMRLAVITAVKITLGNALALLGITAPNKM